MRAGLAEAPKLPDDPRTPVTRKRISALVATLCVGRSREHVHKLGLGDRAIAIGIDLPPELGRLLLGERLALRHQQLHHGPGLVALHHAVSVLVDDVPRLFECRPLVRGRVRRAEGVYRELQRVRRQARQAARTQCSRVRRSLAPARVEPCELRERRRRGAMRSA